MLKWIQLARSSPHSAIMRSDVCHYPVDQAYRAELRHRNAQVGVFHHFAPGLRSRFRSTFERTKHCCWSKRITTVRCSDRAFGGAEGGGGEPLGLRSTGNPQ